MPFFKFVIFQKTYLTQSKSLFVFFIISYRPQKYKMHLLMEKLTQGNFSNKNTLPFRLQFYNHEKREHNSVFFGDNLQNTCGIFRNIIIIGHVFSGFIINTYQLDHVKSLTNLGNFTFGNR